MHLKQGTYLGGCIFNNKNHRSMHPRTILLVAACLLFQTAVAQTPAKIALLTGVGQYPEHSGWQPLHSANDVELLRNTLIQQGFPADNIFTLTEAFATRQAILTAIREQLIARAQPGGTAVFHFSGHGQQVQDDNGDEVDGFDEAVVPYDALRDYQTGAYTGQNHIRDEELGALLAELRRKLGPTGHLMVLVDACHSGTGTRGIAVARGTDILMADPAYIHTNTKRGQDINELGGEASGSAANLAPMVSLFSSSPQELSFEYNDDKGRHYGLMCYAFSKALTQMPREATYRALMDRIKNEVNYYVRRQTPQAEGELDQNILGGKFLGRATYYKVRDRIAPDLVLLDAGQLQGLQDSTVVVFYSLDTRDTLGKPPLATGIVESAKPLDCDVRLDRPLSREQMKNAWVFVRRQHYGDLRLRLQLALPDGPLREGMLEFARERPYIELVDNRPDLLLETTGNRAQLLQRDETVLYRQSAPADPVRKTIGELRKAIGDYLRAEFLRTVEARSDGIEAEIVIWYPYDSIRQVHLSQIDTGKKINITVRNTGSKPFYYNVLDIQPDNRINVVMPRGNSPAAEYYLPPGKSFTSEGHGVSPPLGREVLKIIATPEPVDLANLVATNGASLRGRERQANPLEKLLAIYSFPDNATRGTVPAASAPIGAGLIGTVVVEIVGK